MLSPKTSLINLFTPFWHVCVCHQPRHLYQILPADGHNTDTLLCILRVLPICSQGNRETGEPARDSLVVQWLGRSAFTTVAQVQSLVRELRSRKLRGVAKKKKNWLKVTH